MKYERSGPRHFFRLTLLNMLLDFFPKGGKALDAGCGDGSFSLLLAKKGLDVYALDSSKNWCESAKRKINSLNLGKRIKIICTTLEIANFDANFYDVIFSGEVLEHINNDNDILNLFYQWLKPSGKLIISVPMIAKKFDIYDTMVGHLRLYEYSSLKKLMEDIGYKITKTMSWGFPFTKWYHKYIFLKWAAKFNNENEIDNSRNLTKRIGMNSILSVLLSLPFFIDLLLTKPNRAIGIMLKATKQR